MSAQVKQMIGRFQKTGVTFFNEALKALAIPTVQYAIGAILVLYITFLESENDSVLSIAMTNPLGRLLILLFLLLLTSVSVPLGILFAVLVVMSCANREGFQSVPFHNLMEPLVDSTNVSLSKPNPDGEHLPSAEEGFEDPPMHDPSVELPLPGDEGEEGFDCSADEGFDGALEPASGHKMSPELKEDEVSGFAGHSFSLF